MKLWEIIVLVTLHPPDQHYWIVIRSTDSRFDLKAEPTLWETSQSLCCLCVHPSHYEHTYTFISVCLICQRHASSSPLKILKFSSPLQTYPFLRSLSHLFLAAWAPSGHLLAHGYGGHTLEVSPSLLYVLLVAANETVGSTVGYVFTVGKVWEGVNEGMGSCEWSTHGGRLATVL